MSQYPGKLIVIEGVDGAGKTTQFHKLCDWLSSSGHKVKPFSFPNYSSITGAKIQKYLQGELHDLDPYLIIDMYADDRLAAKNELIDWLEDGYLVVVCRYIWSNIAYNSLGSSELEQYIGEKEYITNKMPSEDLILFLDVIPEITKKLMIKRGVLDIMERDEVRLDQARNIYLDLCEQSKNAVRVECFNSITGNILSIDAIHNLVCEAVQKSGVLDNLPSIIQQVFDYTLNSQVSVDM